jgi:hypothetical protein
LEEGGEVEGRERVAGRGKTKLDVGSHFRSERAKSEEEREKRRRREKRDGKTAAVFCPFPSPLIQSIRGSMSLAEGSERYEVRNRSERRGTRRKKRARVIDLSPLSSTRTTIDLSKKASAIIFLV